MIFVTVGSMLPFDRLIRAVDGWADSIDHEVFAQIGHGKYEPKHMSFARMLTPSDFQAKVASATLVVAHAGMGTVISAMEAGRSIVILPRCAAAREATTNHQVHTARWLAGRSGVFVAATEADLASTIEAALNAAGNALLPLHRSAPSEFIAKIRAFIDG